MSLVSNADSNLMRNLHDIAVRQNASKQLAEHLAFYFTDANLTNQGEFSPDALYGAAVQHHHLGATRQSAQAVVAFYTPDFDRHGWHSPHTVVDVVTDDMPFLVDSVTMLCDRHGLTIHRLIHPVLGIRRDQAGVLTQTAKRDSAGTSPESWIHLEIDRISDVQQLAALRQEMLVVLADVRSAVEDHAAMLGQLETAITDSPENAEFLRWMGKDNFVFLGYAHYAADASANTLQCSEGSGLGLLRQPQFSACLAGIPPGLEAVAHRPASLTLVKTDVKSTLHRQKYLDFVGVTCHDATGKIVGEHVFIGLYAMHVYHISTSDIPVVREKVAAVRQFCGFRPGGHADKTLVNVLETYPRDELIEISAEALTRIAGDIVRLFEHPRVRVFLRDDFWGRYVSALVYLPRDRADTTTRKRIIALLQETLKPQSIDYFLTVGESRLARLHLIARRGAASSLDYDAEQFEREVARIVRGWQDELQHNLVEHCGEERGNALFNRYAAALPLAYQDQVPPSSAVTDLEHLEAAEVHGRIEIKLSAPYGDDGSHQHIKLFLNQQPRPLTAVLPIFDNLGVTVLSEQPFRLQGLGLYLADFAVQLPCAEALEDAKTRAAFIDLLERILRDEAENDGFNRLALLAGLDCAQINVLRAYARYLRQAGLRFTPAHVERCLASYPQIARLLVELFAARLSPNGEDSDGESVAEALKAALAQVSNLDDDQILSAFRTVILATLRTNAWQTGKDGQPKGYLSFKLSSREIPFLPKPLPLYEIFVYCARTEGLHLRGSRVSRGGLRWSDRFDDYRTEVLGLVKAQTVKNAVIVPLGAKGCFVGKRLPPVSEREAWLAEGIECYKIYIRGLLDLTDNLVDGKVVPPSNVRRRDADDLYLVVAADKGTASFSDIANSLSREYGFWLGDAFASGGSVGYSHKQMAITARGAWEAVKRHFRELGHDTQSQPFNVIGIGDMSGDVFGNGMLLSEQIRLVAAFDHRHIFLDPNPDPATTFSERQRLFALPRSSWDDFDRKLISEGGGVWARTLKTIPLSPQIRQVLDITAEQLSPTELISALLKAPVDLIYNGGIGTYVKASTQAHQEANDRGNDALRVNAADMRARVIGEGGNLGLTQKARIEFAQGGGHVFTDALDNSAGVDCSDHEVNIKILLAGPVAAGDMTDKQRVALLAAMTDDVARLVLRDNYQQTQAVALEAANAHELLDAHAQFIRKLEAKGVVDRVIESLPDDKGLAERGQMQRGLTAPEIALLLAYGKIALKEELLASALPDAPELQQLLTDYFPPQLVTECGKQLPGHPLKREIITTQLVNRLINRMGTTFVNQLSDETGADAAQVVAACFAASELLAAESLWQAIEALDLKVPATRQMGLMRDLRELVGTVTQQILPAIMEGVTIGAVIDTYRPVLAQAVKQAQTGKAEGMEAFTAVLEARASIANAVEHARLARSSGKPLAEVVAACALIDGSLDFTWLRSAIARLPAGNRWQARARAHLANELDRLQQALLQRGVSESSMAGSGADAVVDELKRNAPQDLAMLSAGLSEIRHLLGV